MFRMKPSYTKDISDIFMEHIAPVIQRKCSAWAKNEEEYTACRRYVTRYIISHYFTPDRKTLTEIEGTTGVFIDPDGLPSPVRNDELANEAERYISDCNNESDERKRLVCRIQRYTNAMRAMLIGGFVGSAVPEDSPYYLKPKSKKAGTKPTFEAGERRIYELAVRVGGDIKNLCTQFADEASKEPVVEFKKGVAEVTKPSQPNPQARRIAYFYCRVTNVFRSLPRNLPRRLEVQLTREAIDTGLQNVAHEVENETKQWLEEAKQDFMNEVATKFQYLQMSNATETPIPYIQLRLTRRAVTSTIGNAIAKRAGAKLAQSGSSS